MQNLDNDMEDLFREAAENYPLRVTGADWSKVQAALLQEQPPVKDVRSNKRKWLWSLLLLLIPFICSRLQYMNNNNTEINKANTNNAEPNHANTNNTTTNKAVQQYSDLTIQPSSHPSRLNFLLAPIVVKQTNNSTPPPSSNTTIKPYNHSAIQPFTFSSKTNTAITAPLMDEEEDNETDVPAKQTALTAETPKEDKPAKKDTASHTSTAETKDKNELPAAQPAKASDKQKQPSPARFYVSLLGGAGVSKVKTSKFEPAGTSVGVSAGYNISKRFAVEAGAFWSTKNYSTKYKYFNNSKTQWPAVRIIETVHGECKVIEVPVTLRYNFKPTAKHSFFAAAGLSSWIMKKEDYDYTYTTLLNPVQKSMYKSYYNSGNNWFSVLQLSAGWQRNIGKLGAIRVQPYYNLPLHGVGLGSLDVSGFGVLAGFTFSIR